MSRQIDERVAVMRFDNRQFERKVSDTIEQVKELNKGLKFEGASEGLEEVNKQFKKLDASGLEKTIDVVIIKFEQLSAVAFTAINRLTNAVIDFGKKTVDAFAIEPVTTGFNEYELKMASVQTIMSATGASVAEVNAYLDELNEYSDRTIYSFSDMTNNIGKFTNAGVKLKDAVAAIKGISNEAALSGANANEASRAMYNFAQALATGSVKLIDWKSIENANMATVQFKDVLLETASEMGTVEKDASGMYRVLTRNGTGSNMKDTISATRNFNDSLSYQWMTSEVLIEALKKYSDETTEIGRKAYAAAQDVKTFSMMVDTLKEAAQSGWAETWQLIVGDFEQAKNLWTTFTGFFDKIIGDSAKARNELLGNAMKLQNAEGVSGREELWESLTNILSNLINVLRAVKNAWEVVFPPITDRKLRTIISQFHAWTEKIKLSDEQLEKLTSTFKGIFAVLDIFITLARGAFRVLTQLILKTAYVIKVVLIVGFAALLDWIDKVRESTTGFYGWLNGLGTGIFRFIEYLRTLDGLTLSNLFGTLQSFGENVIGSFLDYRMLLSNLTGIRNFVVWIFDAISQGITIGIGYIKTIFNDFLPWFEKAKDKFIEILIDLKNKILSGEISMSTIVMIAVGAGLLLLISTFRKFIKSITEVPSAIAGVFNNISKVINNFATRLKTEAVGTIAKTIATLVTSLAVLVILSNDKDKLLTALAVLGALTAGFVAVSVVISKLDTKSTIAFAASVSAFGVTLVAMAATLGKLRALTDTGGIKGPFKILTLLVTEMLIVMKLMGTTDKHYQTGAMTMLGFVLTLKLMVGVLEDYKNADFDGINRMLKILMTISASLALVGKGFQNVRFGAAATMLATIAVLKTIISAIASLSKFDPVAINRAILSIMKILAMFAGLMLVASFANRNLEKFENTTASGVKKGWKSSTNLKQLAAAVLAMSASLVVISYALKSISAISDDELSRSGSIIAKILLVYGAVVALSAFAGENADKAGKMLMKMSTSVVILMTFVTILSNFVDVAKLDEPLRVIERLMTFMALMVAATGFVPNTDNVVKVFTKLTIAVTVMAVALSAMTFLPDPSGLNDIAKTMGLMMAVFSLMIVSTSKAGKVSGTLIVLTGVMTIMAGLIYVLSELYVARAIENAEALAILMGALSVSMVILSKISGVDKGVMSKVFVMSGITVVLGAVVGALNRFAPGLGTAIQNATGISILLGALAISMRLLKGAEALNKGILPNLAILSLIVGELGVVIGALNYTAPGSAIQNATAIGILLMALAESIRLLQKQDKLHDGIIKQMFMIGLVIAELGTIVGLINQFGWNASITNTISIGILLAAIIASFKFLDGVKALDKGVIGQLALLGLIVGALGLIVGALEAWGDGIQVSVGNAISLSLLLNAMALALNQLQMVKSIDAKAIGVLAIMGLIVAEVQVIVGGLENLGFNVAMNNALALSALIVSLSAAALLASAAGLTGPAGFLGIGILAGLIAAVGGLMALITSITRDNPNVESDLDRAIMVMDKLGNGLGSFFGGIVNGVLQSIDFNIFTRFGEDFKGFTSAMSEALTSLDSVKGESVDKLKSLAGAILTITGAELLDGVSRLLGLGSSGIGQFGVQLGYLGTGIKSFGENTASMAENAGTDYAIELIQQLAEVGRTIPNTGGLLGLIVGNNDMAPFAEQMPILASGIVSFCYRVKNIDQGKYVDFAIDTLTKLAKASHEIPNIGGLLWLLVGDNRMDKFAEQMPTLANGLVSFCYRVKNINQGPAADYAITTMIKLAKASEEIPNTGGLLGDIVGNNDMGPFASGMPTLGQGLFEYCDAVKNITVKGVDISIDVMRKLIDASKNLDLRGGLVGGIWGETDIIEFGSSITWLGKYLSWYAGWIAKITNFDEFYKSTIAVKTIAEVAKIMSEIPPMEAFNGLPADLEALGEDIKKYADKVRGIKTDGISDSLDALKLIISATNEIMEDIGFPKIQGELGIKKWADEITHLGRDLYVYWTWIKITDFSEFDKPVEAVKTIVEMAKEISKVDTRKFNLFGERLVKFIETDFSSVIDAFESIDFSDVANHFSDSLVKSIRENRSKFVEAGGYVVEGFVNGVKIKMSSDNAVENIGIEMADVFLNAFDRRMDIHSPSVEMIYRGGMVVYGLVKGVEDKEGDVEQVGTDVGNGLMDSIDSAIGDDATAMGKQVIDDITNGMTSAANANGGLFDKFQGMWNNLKAQADQGASKIKAVFNDITALDASAGTGEALTNISKKIKDFILGPDKDSLLDFFMPEDNVFGKIDDVGSEINDIMGSVMSEVSSGATTTAVDMSEKLKLELHKHFDSHEYKYLGQQLGETLAIAATGAIVGKNNIANKYAEEISRITARGIDEWKAWLEVRNKYEEISTKDQLAGWELLRQKYAEGTKERMEADQQVYSLQQALVKETYEYSKKWIDTEKYYERLSLEEEIAAWERIQARYMEGSEQRIEAEKQLYSLRKQLREQDLADQKAAIEKEKKYERAGLADELAAYLRMRKLTAEGSNEREEIDEKIYDLRKEIYEAQLEYITNVEAAQTEAAESRLQLEQEYADKVFEINEKLASDIDQLNENYTNTVKQRAKTLYSAYGLFDSVEEKDYDKEELMTNLKNQVSAFEKWKANIDALSKRGLDQALIDELTEMGPSAAGQIKALTEMTDSELGQYNLLWSQKSAMAREQAIGELEELRIETSDNIAKLQQESAKELDEYRELWTAAMSKITEDCDTRLGELKKNFGETVGIIKKDTAMKMQEMVDVSNEILRDAGWTESGEQAVMGIIKGLLNNKYKLIATVSNLGVSLIKALNNALKIKSPSKETKWTGEMAGKGLIQGLASYNDRANDAGYDLAEQIQNGAFEAIKYVNDLLRNGIDDTLTIRPVFDMTNITTGINDMNSMLNTSKALRLATSANMTLDTSRDISFVNPNENVVKELQSLRKDVSQLGEKVASMQLVMDTGAVVGEIVGPLDVEFGSRITRNTRERG